MKRRLFDWVTLISIFFFNSLMGQLKIDSGGRVGIGITNPSTANKLHVVNDMAQYGNYGIWVDTYGGGSSNYGLYARAKDASYSNHGVAGYATTSGSYNYGIRGGASNATRNYSIYGQSPSGGTYRYAGYFAGDVHVTGNFSWGSDIKLKENIKSISPILSNLMKLKPRSYNFKKDAPEFKSMGLASGRHYGFTAQELEEVFPDLVSTEAHPPEDEKGEPLIYKSINYIEMIPILTQAIQEQQEEIEDLKKELGK